MGYLSLSKYGFGIFGKMIPWIGNGLDSSGKTISGTYLWVDCLYIKILQNYGIIFLMILITILTIVMYKICKAEDFYLLVILTVIALHCITDDLSLYMWYNTFSVVIGGYLYNNCNHLKQNLKRNKKIKRFFKIDFN